MSGTRPVPYSLQHVHCAHCQPCNDPTTCLKNETLRRKCPSATRRDDLKKHTATNHPGKEPKVVGDGRRQTKIHFVGKSSSSAQSQQPPSVDESPSVPSTSSATVGENLREVVGTDVSNSRQKGTETVIQDIDSRLRSIESNLTLLMSKCNLSKPDSNKSVSSSSSSLTTAMPTPTSVGPEPFSLRVLERNNLVESCRFLAQVDDVPDSALTSQLQVKF